MRPVITCMVLALPLMAAPTCLAQGMSWHGIDVEDTAIERHKVHSGIGIFPMSNNVVRPSAKAAVDDVALSGRVTDQDGQLVAEVEIRVSSPYGEGHVGASTDADGRYVLFVVPRLYDLLVKAEGFAERRLQGVEIQADRQLDIVLERGLQISGRVTDADGLPVDGLWVAVLVNSDVPAPWQERIISETHTGAEGTYRLRLRPGTYTLRLIPRPGSNFPAQPQGVDNLEMSADRNLDLVLERGVQFTGQVVDKTGAGVYPCVVLALPSGQGLFTEGAFWTHSTADGAFEVRLLKGTYDLLVDPFSHEGTPVSHSGRKLEGVEVVADRDLEVVLAAPERFFALWGTVTGDAESFYLEAYDPVTGHYEGGMAESDGTYRLLLPAGTYGLTLHYPADPSRHSDHVRGVQIRADREYHLVANAGTITGILEKIERVPAAFVLYPTYPNPFNAGTVITYEVPQTGPMQLAVFNLIGQRVRLLVDASQPAGTYRVYWDGKEASGRPLASGVYIIRLQAGTFTQQRKGLLVR